MSNSKSCDNSRGLMIVFEGLDRSGKSTQSRLLADELNKIGYPSILHQFPNRKTIIGEVLNSYLKRDTSISNEACHLLFAANRWEFMNELTELISSGKSVVIDRYSYSGVAYSTSALNLDRNWCMSVEKNLMKPDIVFFMDIPPELLQKRSNYGSELYEEIGLQKKVYDEYKKFFYSEDNWILVDATLPPLEVHKIIMTQVEKTLKELDLCNGQINFSLFT